MLSLTFPDQTWTVPVGIVKKWWMSHSSKSGTANFFFLKKLIWLVEWIFAVLTFAPRTTLINFHAATSLVTASSCASTSFFFRVKSYSQIFCSLSKKKWKSYYFLNSSVWVVDWRSEDFSNEYGISGKEPLQVEILEALTQTWDGSWIWERWSRVGGMTWKSHWKVQSVIFPRYTFRWLHILDMCWWKTYWIRYGGTFVYTARILWIYGQQRVFFPNLLDDDLILNI